MLDASKLTPGERRVLLRSLNMYCETHVQRLLDGEGWSPLMASRVNMAEHLIDVIEETIGQ